MKLTGRHSFLGIAIGERTITVAEVGPARAGRGWEVRRAAEFTPPPMTSTQPIGAAAGAAEAEAVATGEALGRFLRDNGFSGAARAVVGVPARWLVARERELPPSTDEAAADVLRMQAERVFSAELGEVAVDFAGTADPSNARGVLLLAMPRKQLARVVRIVQAAGRDVAAVMPTTLALADAVAANGTSGRASAQRTDGLVLSLGGDAVELAAHRGGAPRLLRHLPVRGPDLASPNGTRAVAVSSLASEIRRTVAMMPRTPDAPGGTRMPPPGAESLRLWDGVGLDHDDAVTLARQAGVDLTGGGADDLSSLGLVAPAGGHVTGPLRDAASRCAPALALALAGASPRPGAVDFLHPRLAPPKRRRVGRRTAWGVVVAAAAVLLLLVLWIEVRWRESNLAALQAELATLEPNVQAAERTSQLIGVARGWYPEGRPAALDCLREITDSFPDGGEAIYVTKFSLPETRQGQFSGRSPNRKLVLELVDRLNKHPNKSFTNAKPDYMLDAGGTSNEVAFSISFTYQGATAGATTTR